MTKSKEELIKILNDPNEIQHIVSIGFIIADKENNACAIRRFTPYRMEKIWFLDPILNPERFRKLLI